MTACAKRALVDAHFRGDTTLADERALRGHLDGCTDCRARYERRLVLAAIDPAALSAEVRIGRPLGLAPEPVPTRRSRLSRIGGIVVGLALAAGVMLFFRPPRAGGSGDDDGFTARGHVVASAPSSTSSEGIRVFRLARDGSSATAAGVAIDRDDELAFSYANPDGAPYLMIFGVDDRGQVFWFHPGWSDAAQTPRAIAVERGGPYELREAIHHRLGPARRLEIHGLFLDAPHDVREIERIVAARPSPFGSVELSGGRDHVLSLEVER